MGNSSLFEHTKNIMGIRTTNIDIADDNLPSSQTKDMFICPSLYAAIMHLSQ